LKLSEWYNGVLKMANVREEYSSGTKTFGGDLTINSLTLESLNGKDWADFAAAVLINGENQTIYGQFLKRLLYGIPRRNLVSISYLGK